MTRANVEQCLDAAQRALGRAAFGSRRPPAPVQAVLLSATGRVLGVYDLHRTRGLDELTAEDWRAFWRHVLLINAPIVVLGLEGYSVGHVDQAGEVLGVQVLWIARARGEA